MPDIKISEVARLTGLSMRYWQRRALRGDMPGAHYFETGNRRIYFVDRDRFTVSAWLGHADVRVTQQRYAFLRVEQLHDAIRKPSNVIRLMQRLKKKQPHASIKKQATVVQMTRFRK